jgi:hypothetical protein
LSANEIRRTEETLDSQSDECIGDGRRLLFYQTLAHSADGTAHQASAGLFDNDCSKQSASGNLKGTGGAGPLTYGNPAEVGFG